MTYRFDPPQEKYVPRNDFSAALIPIALREAQLVSPCAEIQPFWEGAIRRELEQHDPQFSWRNFLYQFLP